MHILVAPNAFKNSLDASSAAKAIAEGFAESQLNCTCSCFPVADGGDGTGQLLTEICGGSFVQETVNDPLWREIKAFFGLIDDGRTAVIEMATASGLRLLQKDELDPLHASSFGTGQLMLKAMNMGVQKIILCVGGSATVDGGTGILQALGIRFLDQQVAPLKNMPEGLTGLAAIDTSGLDSRIAATECIILCDVTNPLLGEKGAAKIFGPQKGADAMATAKLEEALTRFAKTGLETNGIDMATVFHGGAAGGTAAGLHSFLQAGIVNGIDYFLDITGFDQALEKAALVITGEGSIDLQTLEGKAPYGVAIRAGRKKIPVIALAGKVPAEQHPELAACFKRLVSINKEPTDFAAALAATAKNLKTTARELGNELSMVV